MLAGHYAPALALKARFPRVPLGALFVAVQLIDIAWATLVPLGIERARIEPGYTASNGLVLEQVVLSHSLAATALWAAAAALVAQAVFPRRGAGPVVAVAVVSHWFLDLPMHVPDLPLAGVHSLKLGFGLWNHRELSFALEAGLLALSGYWWARSSRSVRVPAAGPAVAPIALGLVLGALAISGYYGPQPESINVTALLGLVVYLTLPFLAWMADRQRPPLSTDG